ncbi:nitrate reductase cytochrome c-type subunit [Inhella gelatinilytica]|uniref:Periplasmic nitrate reductase, electron transfer subunit n=1 Tax=Inhella gelatinilytica TaxID=2795030 RepID=A0A931IT79_9BURK|nr:nitrate reductase cytochrome c-type subunit [Inhella gelatinilytica]MBH9552295.1 nitrate reductase cytochrome c-type subunit [Inhella gelatinilytica]
MKNLPMRWMLVAAAVAAVYGCAQFAGVSTLRGSNADTVDVAPNDKTYVGKRPGGGQERIARSYKEQPPLIPHAIDNFDEITVSDNQCMDCHSPSSAAAKKAPAVPQSHVDATGNKGLNMARYQCNSCHVPQVDAKPLVENRFEGRK